MKSTLLLPVEIEVSKVALSIPNRHGDWSIDLDFPFFSGDRCRMTIDIESGKIDGWPENAGSQNLYMLVSITGNYALLAPDGTEVARMTGQSPPRIIPSHFGDTIDLEIAADGTITNWPMVKDISDFFPDNKSYKLTNSI